MKKIRITTALAMGIMTLGTSIVTAQAATQAQQQSASLNQNQDASTTSVGQLSGQQQSQATFNSNEKGTVTYLQPGLPPLTTVTEWLAQHSSTHQMDGASNITHLGQSQTYQASNQQQQTSPDTPSTSGTLGQTPGSVQSSSTDASESTPSPYGIFDANGNLLSDDAGTVNSSTNHGTQLYDQFAPGKVFTVTVTTVDTNGHPLTNPSDQTVYLLSTNASGRFFSIETGKPIDSVQIPAGSTGVKVYYENQGICDWYDVLDASLTPSNGMEDGASIQPVTSSVHQSQSSSAGLPQTERVTTSTSSEIGATESQDVTTKASANVAENQSTAFTSSQSETIPGNPAISGSQYQSVSTAQNQAAQLSGRGHVTQWQTGRITTGQVLTGVSPNGAEFGQQGIQVNLTQSEKMMGSGSLTQTQSLALGQSADPSLPNMNFIEGYLYQTETSGTLSQTMNVAMMSLPRWFYAFGSRQLNNRVAAPSNQQGYFMTLDINGHYVSTYVTSSTPVTIQETQSSTGQHSVTVSYTSGEKGMTRILQ